jgi:hypothetical protein
MRITVPLCLLAWGILVAAVPARAVSTLSATASASVYATDGWGDYTSGPPVNNHETDVPVLTAQDHIIFPAQATSVSYPAAGNAVQVSAVTGATASLGDLHVYTSSQGATDGSSNFSFGSGTADATASFTDSLTINATGSHPVGTWVWINARLAIDKTIAYGSGAQLNFLATLSAQGASSYDSKDESGNPFGLNNMLFDNFGCINMVPTAKQTLDLTGQFRVGQTYTIHGDLSAHVLTNAGNTQYGLMRGSSGTIDASNTSHSYFWSDDPTVVITTGSGASYALPVPEPSSLACLLLGGTALLARRRKPNCSDHTRHG